MEYLPAYSPDLNAIEQCSSKLKALLGKAAARSYEALDQAISEALGAITASDVRGWFTHCGYMLTSN